MASLVDLTRNNSFYTVPAAWVLALAPRIYAVSLYESKSSQKFDTKCPRTFIAKCEADQSIDNASKAISCSSTERGSLMSHSSQTKSYSR